MLGNVTKVTQLVSGRAGVETLADSPQKSEP